MNEREWRLENSYCLESVTIRGVLVTRGDRVRLRPRQGSILDAALANKIATVESIEQDHQGGFHLSVVVDDAAGRHKDAPGVSDSDMTRKPFHRYFFCTTEIDPIEDDLQADAA